MIIIEWGDPLELSNQIRQYNCGVQNILFDLVSLWKRALHKQYYYMGTRDIFGRPLLILNDITNDKSTTTRKSHSIRTQIVFTINNTDVNFSLDAILNEAEYYYKISIDFNISRLGIDWDWVVDSLNLKPYLYCCCSSNITLRIDSYERDKLEDILNRAYRYLNSIEDEDTTHQDLIRGIPNNNIQDFNI